MKTEPTLRSRNGWNQAIADAQVLLDKVERKAGRLRSAIRTFKENRNAGEAYRESEVGSELAPFAKPAPELHTPELAAAIKPLAQVEREAILAAVAHFDGDRIKAAEALDMGKTTLYRKLKEYREADRQALAERILQRLDEEMSA